MHRFVLIVAVLAVGGLAGCRDHSRLAGAGSTGEVRVPARLTGGRSVQPSSTLILGLN